MRKEDSLTDDDTVSFGGGAAGGTAARLFPTLRDRRLLSFLAGIERNPALPIRVVELGCGWGRSAEILGAAFESEIDYQGFDIDEARVARCTARRRTGFRFQAIDLDRESVFERLNRRPDAIIALETFARLHPRTWHTIAAGAALRAIPLFVTVPNDVGPALLVRMAAARLRDGEPRDGGYAASELLDALRGRFDRLPPQSSVGRRGFDWRALSHTLRQYYDLSLMTDPTGLLPPLVSPSLTFACRPMPPADHLA